MSDDAARKPKSDEPPGLALDDKSPSPSLGLRVAAGGGRPGLRSPLAGVGAGSSSGVLAPLPSSSSSASASGQSLSGGSSGSASASGRPAAALATPPLRELSGIRGMSQTSHHLPAETAATHVSHVMYDPAPARSKKLLLVLFLAALVGGAYHLYKTPSKRRLVFAYVQDAKEEFLGLVNPATKKPKPKVRPAVGGGPRRAVTDPASTGARRTCQQLILDSSGGGRMTVADRVDVAECHLVQGDFVSAEAALKPLQSRIQRTSEAELNGTPASRSISDAHQTMLATLIREGKSQEASRMVAGMCVRWQQTNSCVAKAMMLADRRLAAPGIDAMFGSQGKLDRKAQARLWLAGAQLASSEDRASTAERRYSLAIAAAPKSSLALRKSIYEAQAVDQFNRGNVAQLKKTVDQAMAELKPIGKEGKVKLRILLDLATASDRARFTRSLLTREEMTFRVRRDIDLIEVVGPESLRYGLEADYLRLLTRTKEFYNDRYRATDSIVRKLMAWEIRATLSSGDPERALILSQSYERAYGADVFSKHMRGIAYHLASPHDRYQALAAQEFQAAMRLSRNWESLFALGVTLTRAGKKDTVSQVIKDLDKMTTTKGQRFWSDMLKAEWYTAQGKFANAEQVLDGWIHEKPQFFTPRRLLQRVYEQATRKGEATRVEQSLTELGSSRRYQGSLEAFASPLGPMALGKRPLE